MRWLIVILGLPALLWAQEYQFRREIDTIPVIINGYELPAPWTGGYVETYPALCDWDGDGDKDCFIGHSGDGTIAYYENTGSAVSFLFTLADTAWLGIDVGISSSPAFADLDNDGDWDLTIFGSQPFLSGAYLYENVGSSTLPEYILVDTLRDNTGAIIDISSGTWADIDADGNLDYFTGNWDYGYIHYYHNEGSGWNYSLQLISTNWLGSAVGGDPASRFSDLDSDGDLDLFIGNFNGTVWYFRNDGTAQQYNFTLVSSSWLGIDVGNNSSPEFADMDGDGDFDLWVGRDVYDHGPANTPGDVYYFENIGTPQLPQFQQVRSSNLTLDAGVGNIPNLNDFNAGGNLDLLFSNDDYLIFYENSGTLQQPLYQLVSEDYLPDFQPYAFDLYDLDADGDLDLICANGMLFSAEIIFYENVGGPQNPLFTFAFSIPNLPYTALWPVSLADIDADGDGDMIFGTWGNGIVCYQNQGTPQVPNFVLQSENWQNIPSQRSPCLVDMDLDGDYDLLAGFNVLGLVEFWENVGTPQGAQMVLADSDFCGNVHSPKPAAGDLDNDGDIDLMVGSSTTGGIYFFRNITGEVSAPPPVERHPQAGLQISLGSNPANPLTVVSCQLPVASCQSNQSGSF